MKLSCVILPHQYLPELLRVFVDADFHCVFPQQLCPLLALPHKGVHYLFHTVVAESCFHLFPQLVLVLVTGQENGDIRHLYYIIFTVHTNYSQFYMWPVNIMHRSQGHCEAFTSVQDEIRLAIKKSHKNMLQSQARGLLLFCFLLLHFLVCQYRNQMRHGSLSPL